MLDIDPTKYTPVFTKYLEDTHEERMRLWEKLINQEGRTDEPDNLKNVSQLIKDELEKEGMRCQLIPVGNTNAPILLGILGEHRGNKPILFSGHYDTVFKSGQFGPYPFHTDGDNAFGPGVLDMKGGIIIAIYVIKFLNIIGYDKTPIKVVLAGDEEGDRGGALTTDLLEMHSKDCLFAFNMETGCVDGSVCVGRKGLDTYTLKVFGKGSHPGNAFKNGKNAIEEMAHKIIALQQLSAPDASYTVSVGVINGGTVANIIPDKCSCMVDVRYSNRQQQEMLTKQILEICERQWVSDTRCEIIVETGMPPYETNDGVKKLYSFVCKTASRWNIEKPRSIVLGGASDAAYICKTNTPVLCSCGVWGEGNHTDQEYAIISSMEKRISLLTATILDCDKFSQMISDSERETL